MISENSMHVISQYLKYRRKIEPPESLTQTLCREKVKFFFKELSRVLEHVNLFLYGILGGMSECACVVFVICVISVKTFVCQKKRWDEEKAHCKGL